MKMPSRAQAAIAAMLLAFAGCLPQAARADADPSEILAGPMVGSVTEHSAHVWMELSVAKPVTVTCFDVEKGIAVSGVKVDVEGQYPFVANVLVNGLQPNKDYRIEVKLDDVKVQVFGPGLIIRTTPPAGAEATFAVGLGSNLPSSAMHGLGSAPAIKTINAFTPRAFLFLGNTGTLPAKPTDWPDPRSSRNSNKQAFRLFLDSYSALRRESDLLPLFRTTPCYAVWNDRDFGPIGADKNWVYRKEAWAAFERFWPNPDWGTPDNPGCYCSFTIGDADFFLLDSRMFRDPDADPARQTMFGDKQMDWLKKNLADSKATFKIIASGSELLADYGQGDTWAHYQPEQKEFLHWLFSNHISGVVFAAGGRLGEITMLKPAATDPDAYPLFELSSGGLAGKGPPKDADLPNPHRVGNAVLENNFGMLDFGGTHVHRFVTLRLRTADGKIQGEQTLFATQLKK